MAFEKMGFGDRFSPTREAYKRKEAPVVQSFTDLNVVLAAWYKRINGISYILDQVSKAQDNVARTGNIDDIKQRLQNTTISHVGLKGVVEALEKRINVIGKELNSLKEDIANEFKVLREIIVDKGKVKKSVKDTANKEEEEEIPF
jgi:hypothetical protein